MTILPTGICTNQNLTKKMRWDLMIQTDQSISKNSKLLQRKSNTWWGRWSTGNCARNWNLSVLRNGTSLAVRVFANGPGDLGSIPGRVIPKTQKMVLDASLLNTQHYKVRIKGKVEQSREVVAPSPTPWCSSYRKKSLRVTLDYGRLLYFALLYLRVMVIFRWLFLFSSIEATLIRHRHTTDEGMDGYR